MDFLPRRTMPSAPRASRQDGSSIRPQLLRRCSAHLDGPWGFRADDGDEGIGAGWFDGLADARLITVPFPPESPASGIGETGFHPIIWYERLLSADDLQQAGWQAQGGRLLLHLGAVDYRCEVWVNGRPVGSHEGGHVPFSCDITDAVDPGRADQRVVVRAEDDPHDIRQPRGKQDWQEHPHVIWYERTSGIWQPVSLEAVPRQSITRLRWDCDLAESTVMLGVQLSRRPTEPTTLEVRILHDDELLAGQRMDVLDQTITVTLELPRQRNGQDYDHLLWTPDRPVLLDAEIVLRSGDEEDVVGSYLGLRTVATDHDRFLLNDRPVFVRSVLSQGYWPQSHLAAPSGDALRREVELIKELGFNAARLHQKIEDPRLLYWADRLGLMVWEEMPSAFDSSRVSQRRVVDEWMSAVERDASHPSIVAWVPLNESWSVQHIARDTSVQAFARGLSDLTRAIDPSRPVVSNDGWEHVASDLITVHDYEGDGDVLRERYGSVEALRPLLEGMGPAGRRILLSGEWEGRPVMVTEFGGIKFEQGSGTDSWGYTVASSPENFAERLAAVFGALNSSPALSGWCYTQLTDTAQEKNGLLTENREPKLPIKQLRALIRGDGRSKGSSRRSDLSRPRWPATRTRINDNPSSTRPEPPAGTPPSSVGSWP